MTTTALALARPEPLIGEPPENLPPGLTVADAVGIAKALQASHAESTRITYATMWRSWERWCAARSVPALPADPVALAAFLVERANAGIAVATLDLVGVAIRYVHRTNGYPNPSEAEVVRHVRMGLRRIHGTAPRRQARPLSVADVRRILSAIDRSKPIGVRDAAIILLGFASALRGGELVTLNLADIEPKPAGLLITIRKSKTDQEGHGQTVAVARGTQPATDPVAALDAWLALRGHHPGRLFTRIWDSYISDQELGNNVVARMLRQRAINAGLDGARITAHSLRAGHATTAALAGVPLTRIAAQTRHKDLGL